MVVHGLYHCLRVMSMYPILFNSFVPFHLMDLPEIQKQVFSNLVTTTNAASGVLVRRFLQTCKSICKFQEVDFILLKCCTYGLSGGDGDNFFASFLYFHSISKSLHGAKNPKTSPKAKQIICSIAGPRACSGSSSALRRRSVLCHSQSFS